MARGLVAVSHDIHAPASFGYYVLVVFVVISAAAVDPSTVKNFKRSYAETSGDSSEWHHCPQGWTLFNNKCYKVIETALTWTQAQALCRSSGGNLVKISSQYEQDWVSQFVSEHLPNPPYDVDNSINNEASLNGAGEDGTAVWIGFLRQQDQTYQWSDGQNGVEQDGFWAVDGLQTSDGESISRLCCDMRALSPDSKDLRWYLSNCEDLCASVCELQACEEHAMRCADGTKCISKTWICDGHLDCPDGSDELECRKSLSPVAAAKQCGSTFKGYSGTIYSPNFPGEYPPFLNCTWKIETTPPDVIEILVESLATEEKYDCLKIYEGSEAVDMNLIVSLDGNKTEQSLVKASSSFVTITFVTDHSVQGMGFNITWFSGKTKMCGGQLTAADTETLITFPEPDQDISLWGASKQLSCNWLIASPNSSSLLSLQFRNITLEEGDSITVYDGSGKDDPVICHINSSHGVVIPSAVSDFASAAVSSSLNIPPVIISSSQYVFIRAIISKDTESVLVLSYKNGCDTLISSSSSLILSPGFPNSFYPDNLNCSWTVSKDRLGRQFTLLFLPHFVTEADKDYVQVHNLEKKQATRYSGSFTDHQQRSSSHDGFIIEFVSDSTVNRGRWAALISYDCDKPSLSSHVVPNSTDTRFGSTIGYSCATGFNLEGPSHSVCGIRGHWLPPELPKCVEINCGSVPVPFSTYLTNVTGTTYNSQASYQCLFGFNMLGHDMATCGETGWKDVPSCEVVTCPKEPPPPGGTARAEDIRFGTLREYFCKPNCRLTGSKFSHCDLLGHWTDPVPSCEVPTCAIPHGILNGHLNQTGSVAVGQSVHVICDTGYTPNGPSELTCLDTQQFNGRFPSCTDINECENPQVCGPHLCQNFPGGYSCFCGIGYQHPHSSSQHCVDINECAVNNGGCSHECINQQGGYECHCPQNMSLYAGDWDRIGSTTLIPSKSCIATCRPFVVGQGGEVRYTQKPLSNGELLNGTVAMVSCPTGRYPNGASVVTCEAGIGWSSPITQCAELTCETPVAPKNGHIFYSDQGKGAHVMYSCHPHYVLHGPKHRFCIEDTRKDPGKVNLVWSGPEPSCEEVNCPTPQPPVNGSVDFRATTYKSVAVFRCECGYELVGQSVSRCMSDGIWSHPTPTCEEKSCSYPGMPADATIMAYEPGFPVGSLVTFQCKRKGYQLSSEDPLKCLPYKQSKLSLLQPYLDISVVRHFVIPSKASLDPACAPAHVIEQWMNIWYERAIETCQSCDIDFDVKTETATNGTSLKMTAHLLMSSSNTATTCACGQDMMAYFSNSSAVSSDIVNGQLPSCSPISVTDSRQLSSQWECEPGLRLEGGTGQQCGLGSIPHCIEECVDEGIETFHPEHFTKPPQGRQQTSADKSSLTPGSSETDKPTSSKPGRSVIYTTPGSVTDPSLSRHTTLKFATTTPAHISTVEKDSDKTLGNVVPHEYHNSFTTESPSTRYITTEPDLSASKGAYPPNKATQSQDMVTQKLNPVDGEQTFSTTKMTTVMTPSSSKVRSIMPSTQWPFFTSSGSPSQAETTPTTQETSSPLPTHAPSTTSRSVLNDRPIPNVDFPPLKSTLPTTPGLDAVLTETNSPKDTSQTEGLPRSETAADSESRDKIDSPTNPSTIDCASLSRQHHSCGSQSSTNISSSWSEDSDLFRGDINTTEGSTFSTLEKQEITMVPGSTAPTANLSRPVFSVEVNDRMSGGFGNILCIDAVHDNINGKVNELLREFGNQMGKLVCQDAPDSSLELTAGNIRFKGTRARIFIKFSIAYSVSSKIGVESCAMEFQDYAMSQLPKKFEKVQREVPASQCPFVNYTRLEFNISFQGWSCRNGYALDEKRFQCFNAPPKSDFTTSSAAFTSHIPSTLLATIPRLSMMFRGSFTSLNSPFNFDKHCADEYSAALVKVLSWIEPHLQSRYIQCKNLFIDITNNVTVTLRSRGVTAEAAIHLIPLQADVQFSTMSKCSRFISVQFRDPAAHLSSVTLSRDYLPTCPEISLSPHGIRSEGGSAQLYCAQGYLLSDSNFKCIKENLPLHASGIELVLSGGFEGNACPSVVRASASQLIEDVTEDVRQSLTSGHLCNTSRNIIVLQLQGNVSIQRLGVTLFIPLTLVSLQGNKSDSEGCTAQLYKYLSASLSQPVSTMVDTLKNKCLANIAMPGDYTVAYTRWECFPGHKYNSAAHKCESVPGHSTVSQTEDRQSGGPSPSARHRRDAPDFQLRPQWNASLPECLDLEPPVFKDCPDWPVIIPSDHVGPYQDFALPTATDSTGNQPKVTVLPSDFRLPYKFTKNTTIEMEAQDVAGNIARCIINVIIDDQDQVLPHISCPTQLVTIVDASGLEYPNITYENIGVIARDNSGYVSIGYDPPSGATVKATDVILVKATAEDENHNMANCSFQMIIEPQGCPNWTLPAPAGGNRTCSFAGLNKEGYSCSVSCDQDQGKAFAVQPPEQYICQGSSWYPHSRVPECLDGRFSDYELQLSFYLTYKGSKTQSCLDEALMEVVDSVKPRLSPACNSSAEHLMNVTFMQLGHLATSDHNSKSTMLTVKIKISIQTQPPHSDMAAGVAHFCGMLTMPQLKFNTTLKSSCGEITLTDPTEARGIESCPQGYTLVSKKCYQCPPGSYWNVPQCIDCPQDSISNVSGEASCFMGFDCPAGMYRKMPECIECPRGTYQTTSGSKHCMACGKGYSTPSPGAKSVDQCVAECDVNHYSYNGLEPCLPCPLGTHQPSTGSYRCETCVFDMDGLSQSDYCREPCQPGEFSSDGTRPCQPCPRNYYTPYNGSTSCLECPDSRVTLGEDSVSASQCQVKDPCQGSPCKHRGICLPFGRDFECECTSGWKGPTCQERMDICDDQPCHNNGQCVHHRDTFTCNCEAGFTGPTCDIDITVTDHCLLNHCVHGICKSLTSGFQCNCLAGYEGQRCEKNTDDCAGVTCHNSGTCVDLVDGYYCLCADGFTGNLCESNIDDCQPDSCLNGGTCVDGDKSFRCLCPPGFDGDFCEVNTDECSSSPCVNDGLCQDGINSYTCLCKPGYTGHLCESAVNPCNSKPCFNGGVCSNSKSAPAGFRCNCSEGYRGARCEQIVNHCQPMPCNMSGTLNCVNTAAGFQCNCLLGWKGHLCDQPMDPCSSQPCDSGTVCVRNGLFSFNCLCANPLMGPACLNSSTSCQSNPCQNKGTCVDKSDGFVCHCRPGFTGSFCEVNIDECTSQPCRNGGTCRDGVNAFTCKCPKGFAGELCKIDIDECLSQPCQHNSACKELDGDFLCDCSPGYTGKTCDTDLDECESRPCQHQGKCVDKIAGYDCICPQGYTGAQCESALDGCLDNTQCLNGASCRRVDNKDLCHCTPEFTGPDCGKEKSANFDLHFLGDLRSGSLPPVVETRNLSSFSLCLWVRFTVEDSEGTFLTLTSEDGYFPYLILSGSQAVSPMFSPLDIAIELHINDGWWHHLCWVVDAGHWIMYLKGKPVREGEIAKWLSGDSLMLRLGRPMIGEDDDERFKGHLHGVNIYSFALHSEDIFNMSQHCQVDLLGGDVFNWAVVDQYLHGNVVVTMPSECGQIFCSNTDENGLCSFPSAVDKIPPVVTNCPEMVMVTSEKTLVPVTWLEPEFSDNVGIVAVRQNFRPGQVFQHGQYLVTYIGYDAENNSAECSFQVFVRKFACIDPPPPANGARVCGEWEHGRYCIPSCTSSYHFVTPIPPFYRCGFEGVWDPPNGDPFSFPACARTYPPAHLMFGGMIFEGPECTEKFLNELRDKLVRILTQIDNVIGLCDPGRVCDYTDSLNVVCGQEDQTRRKRAVSQNTEIYTVILNISVSATASMSGELMPTEAIIEEIVSTIKRNQTELDFTLTSTDIKMSPHCKAGQVLTTGDKTLCLDCPAGHYVNEKSACSPCPKGWYNNKPLQLECVQCSAGLTTVKEGSTSASQCITVCEIGTYFSVNTSQCELCPVGQYQSQAGQQRCDSCPVGLTTHGKGTSSASDCLDLCGAGEELGRDGACAPCPTGTYRPAEATELFCISCPYGLTTAEEGAIHQNQCTLAECGKGFYHQPEDKSCVPCPLGTFQQLRGASSCEPCGVGLTTLQEGADSRSLCQPGVVDECKLMTDLCSPDTECVDLEDGYACEYVCENYCDRLNSCDEDTHKDMDQTVDCDCEVEVCPASRDKMFRSLVIGSMTVTAVATLVLLIIISVWIFRKNQQRKQGMEVRMYRDERKPVAFTNEAFDSLQGQMNLDSEEHLQQMPPTMATRWHSRSFMSGMPSPTFPDDDEIESTDL